MTRHLLAGRTESELLWFQRRSFLQAAAAWTALGGWAGAQAQERGNIVQLLGEARVNGQRLLPRTTVQTGDQLETGPGSSLIFVIGNSAFHLRQNTRLSVERGDSLNTVSVLRMVSGAVASVWGRGKARQVVTPTLTAGIRGTGVYTEVLLGSDNRTYFCNCYGTVDLNAAGERGVSTTEYHESYWAESVPVEGRRLRPAQAINHTDEELETLAQLAGEQTAWQLSGRKGVKY